ncbi:MAG: HAD family hydrolase [Patescibacteria group bacterium]
MKILGQPVTKIGFDLNGTLAIKEGDVYEAYPGGVAAVQTLHSWGLTLALVTDSSVMMIERILEDIELPRKFFSVVVSGNDLSNSRKKPNPYVWEMVAKSLRGSNDGLAIEDSPSGVVSAVTAGWLVAAIKSTHTVEELQSAGACIIVESFAELLDLFEED